MSFDACRFCERGELFRVRRKRFDVALSLLGLYPYRCDACAKRSYRFSERKPRAHGEKSREPKSERVAGPVVERAVTQSAAAQGASLVHMLQRFAVGDAAERREKRS